MERLLTSGEAARFLGISKPTVARAVQHGLLRPAMVTPGHHRRFREADLLALCVPPAPAAPDVPTELLGRPVPRRRRAKVPANAATSRKG